jgi:hypothetical protein
MRKRLQMHSAVLSSCLLSELQEGFSAGMKHQTDFLGVAFFV